MKKPPDLFWIFLPSSQPWISKFASYSHNFLVLDYTSSESPSFRPRICAPGFVDLRPVKQHPQSLCPLLHLLCPATSISLSVRHGFPKADPEDQTTNHDSVPKHRHGSVLLSVLVGVQAFGFDPVTWTEGHPINWEISYAFPIPQKSQVSTLNLFVFFHIWVRQIRDGKFSLPWQFARTYSVGCLFAFGSVRNMRAIPSYVNDFLIYLSIKMAHNRFNKDRKGKLHMIMFKCVDNLVVDGFCNHYWAETFLVVQAMYSNFIKWFLSAFSLSNICNWLCHIWLSRRRVGVSPRPFNRLPIWGFDIGILIGPKKMQLAWFLSELLMLKCKGSLEVYIIDDVSTILSMMIKVGILITLYNRIAWIVLSCVLVAFTKSCNKNLFERGWMGVPNKSKSRSVVLPTFFGLYMLVWVFPLPFYVLMCNDVWCKMIKHDEGYPLWHCYLACGSLVFNHPEGTWIMKLVQTDGEFTWGQFSSLSMFLKVVRWSCQKLKLSARRKIGIDGMEKAINFGIQPNMIVYLMGSYGLEMASASNILFWWGAISNFAPIVAAFLADAYVGRFRMICFGAFFSLMGMSLLWSTSMIPSARPSCKDKNICSSATPYQIIFLCTSFALLSIGTGGIRSSTVAFGADQVVKNEEEDDPRESRKAKTSDNEGVIGSFFNWLCVSMYLSIMFALTFLVYIQDHMGWKVGFGLPLLLLFISIVCFIFASPLYVKAKPKSSLLIGFARVIVASWRNRHFRFPSNQRVDILYHVAQGSTLVSPSEKLRLLNKACIIKDPRQEVSQEGIATEPWHLCTTDEVEELKSILSILPIWSTGIIFAVIPSQKSFQILQANAMDKHFLSPTFEIPAGSFGIFSVLIAFTWLILYDRVIIPLASKVGDKPGICSIKTRMGVGFVFSTISMVLAAVLESVRRNKATMSGAPMSAMWLVPQTCFIGLADAIGGVAQIELFYSETPRTMSSIAANLYGLGLAVASVVASFIMSFIDHITKRGGHQSWVSGDVNEAHYDYYYWVLAALSLLNFLYFLLCSRAYWPGKKEVVH